MNNDRTEDICIGKGSGMHSISVIHNQFFDANVYILFKENNGVWKLKCN